MNLVEDDPFQITNDVGPIIEHRPKNFRRHDEASRLSIDLNVASQKPHVSKSRLKVSEFLV